MLAIIFITILTIMSSFLPTIQTIKIKLLGFHPLYFEGPLFAFFLKLLKSEKYAKGGSSPHRLSHGSAPARARGQCYRNGINDCWPARLNLRRPLIMST